MIKQLLNKFSKKRSKGLAIIWPYEIKTNVYELDYATQFCKKYVRDAGSRQGINFNWIDIGNIQDEKDYSNIFNKVLVMKTNRIIISEKLIKVMMGVIDKGYDACGPCFNHSLLPTQQSMSMFPIINGTTYEEFTDILSDKKFDLQEIFQLDNTCVMYSAKFFKQHQKVILKDTRDTVQSDAAKDKFAVVRNSLVFVFREDYGTERHDLVGLIPEKARNVLDIGSAEGGLGKVLQETKHELEIDAVELSKPLVEKAKPWYSKVYHCSFENFISEKKYDVIICGDVIEHMLDPWKQICKMYDLLNPGGCLIASLPNAGHWSLIYDQLQGKFEYLPVGLTCVTHVRWFTEKSIKSALKDCGFQIDLFERLQLEPSPKGKEFIDKMVELGFGDEKSMLTNEFTIRAIKK